MNRRNFISKAVVTLGTVSLLPLTNSGKTTEIDLESMNEKTRWLAVRAQFDQLSADKIHMSSFFLVSHPKPVREAIERHRRAIDGDPLSYVEENIVSMQGKIQSAAAEYLGGRSSEVAITNSTTMGLAHVYHGIPLNAGHEILTTTHDHFVHHEAIRLAAERSQVSVRKISLFDSIGTVSRTAVVERIRKAISPKTKVVGITWVHSSTGLKLPVREIGDAIADANRGRAEADRLLLVVDGVHGFGVEDESIAGMGADFFVAGTHKWMFGPRGTGIVWARDENWKTLRMIFPAFAAETVGAWIAGRAPADPPRASWVTQGGFHAFEYEWALPAAFEFHKKIGRTSISERIHSLNDQCKEGLSRMPNIKLHTPMGSDMSAGLICFEVGGMKSADVVRRLHERNIIASTAPYREAYVRLAPSLVNTPGEVDTTLSAIRSLG